MKDIKFVVNERVVLGHGFMQEERAWGEAKSKIL